MIDLRLPKNEEFVFKFVKVKLEALQSAELGHIPLWQCL